MKIETEIVTEFFTNLKYLAEQIGVTVHSGDDGFENCVDEQISEIKAAINSFTIVNLTPITTIKKGMLSYVDFYEKYHTSFNDNTELSPSENIKLYKGGLYTHIKKALRELKDNDLATVKNEELFNWIEASTIIGTHYEKLIYTNEWYYSSLDAINDVVNEIIEHRKKAPQQKLF